MKKFLALFLTVVLIFSLVACANQNNTDNENDDNKNETKESDTADESKPTEDEDKNTSSNNDDNNNSNNNTTVTLPTTEEEIIAYVVSAIDTSSKYTDSLTTSATGTRTQMSKDENGVEKTTRLQNMAICYSFDAKNKLWYSEESNKYTSESDSFDEIQQAKTFVDNGTLYLLEKSTNKENEESKTSENYFITYNQKYTSPDYSEYFKSAFDTFKGFKLAENIAELRSAYDTAFPSYLTNVFPTSSIIPTANTQIKAEQKDGICSLTIDSVSSLKAEENENSTAYSLEFSSKISAKDGKIIEFYVSVKTSTEEATNGTITESSYTKIDMLQSFKYSFDKEKYDNLTVKLPEDSSEISMEEDFSITCYVNGLKDNTKYLTIDEDPQKMFDSLFIKQHINGAERVTVKIFKDKDMTQEITRDTVTLKDILSLKEIYISITPDADIALIISASSERENYSRPYQLVASTLSYMMGSNDLSQVNGISIAAGEHQFNSTFVNSPEYEIWVNGEKLAEKPASIAIEAGKCYNIEYVELISDPVVKN